MFRRFFLIGLCLGMTSAMGLAGSGDDYVRIARLSYLDGPVSFQHSGDVDWTAASINLPLQPGDRIYTANDGRAEIEFDDGSVYRLAEMTDVEILSLKEDLIQIRVSLGLSTLTVRSGVSFEVDAPAAAFTTLRKGVYRFDVVENGDTDAIARKGQLEAANDQFSRSVESGELIHVTPGEKGTNTLSRYDRRDDWDDWNDRRNADMLAYKSREYLPNNVYMGVSELDSYGRWVVVDTYGPAWVPYNVDPFWSPYWVGRWCYRPFWGWTWVSYEPWGWLPYHYGRWYHSAGFGWCWLPGLAFEFNFWSPGLVRFYHGPGWISWCALGPHDYYNVNHYHFNRSHAYQLNNLRALQSRAPDDPINRHVTGAFRTVQTDQFVSGSFGGRDRVGQVSSIDQPWSRGQMVTDRLGIQPTSRSYSPAPDKPVMRPARESSLPTVVRTEPAVRTGPRDRIVRITNPNLAPLPSNRFEGRGEPGSGAVVGRGTESSGESGSGRRSVNQPGRGAISPAPDVLDRKPQDGTVTPGRAPGRAYQTPQRERSVSPAPSTNDSSRNPGRDYPNTRPAVRPDNNPPRRMESTPAPAQPRIERPPAAPERKSEPDRTKPPSNPRSNESAASTVNSSRSNWAGNASRSYADTPRAPEVGRWESSYAQPRSREIWRQQEAPAYVPPSYSRGGGYAAPSYQRGSGVSAPSFRVYSTPPAARGGSFGGGFAHSAPSQAPSASGSGRHRSR